MKAESAISVFKPLEGDWTEAARNPEETDPPGRSCTAFDRNGFSVGFWERDVQRRHFVRPYHEVAYIIEGDVEITLEDGEVLRAGAGDILVTPKGSRGFWRNLSPVRKCWAVFDE